MGSGLDTEVSEYPGHLSTRLVAQKQNTGTYVAFAWLKPLLMMIHKKVEQLRCREKMLKPTVVLRLISIESYFLVPLGSYAFRALVGS